MRYFLLSLSFISIIPLPQKFLKYDNNFHKIVGYFPLAGAFIGLLSYLFYYLLSSFLLPKISFLLSIFFYHFLNGGLHLDGFADFFDAFFGAKKDRNRFKEILKDSRIGAMGTFALLLYFSVILKAVDNYIADINFFIFLGMSGRATIVNLVTFSRSIFDEGLGKFFIEKTGIYEFLLGNASFFLISIFLGWTFVYLSLILFLLSYVFKFFILRYCGGFSGDLFGAGCILTELIIFLSIFKV